jgi:hypothetical protein
MNDYDDDEVLFPELAKWIASHWFHYVIALFVVAILMGILCMFSGGGVAIIF